MVVMAVADRIGYLVRCKGMELNAEDIIQEGILKFETKTISSELVSARDIHYKQATLGYRDVTIVHCDHFDHWWR